MEDPFNPTIPADFKLLTEGKTKQQEEPSGTTAAFTAGSENARRKSSRSGKQTAGSRTRKRSSIPWEHLKEKINGRLGSLDKEKLKTALVACGLSAAVVAAVVLMVKLMPAAVVLLSLVGLAMVTHIWRRLSRTPGSA